MKKPILLLAVAMCALMAGCSTYKEYTYIEYPISRENAFDAMRAILVEEGYPIDSIEENYVNDLPEVIIESDWNLRQTGSVYMGNDYRRRAYVKITTLYSERKPAEYQPLSEEEGARYKEMEEERKKRADLEQTRIGVAVRLERRTDIKRPLEADWQYEGPDNFAVAEILGRFEASYGEKNSRSGMGPSEKSQRLREDDLRNRR